MNKENIQCYKIHVERESSSDSDSGHSELDDEFYRFQPPSKVINNVVTIVPDTSKLLSLSEDKSPLENSINYPMVCEGSSIDPDFVENGYIANNVDPKSLLKTIRTNLDAQTALHNHFLSEMLLEKWAKCIKEKFTEIIKLLDKYLSKKNSTTVSQLVQCAGTTINTKKQLLKFEKEFSKDSSNDKKHQMVLFCCLIINVLELVNIEIKEALKNSLIHNNSKKIAKKFLENFNKTRDEILTKRDFKTWFGSSSNMCLQPKKEVVQTTPEEKTKVDILEAVKPQLISEYDPEMHKKLTKLVPKLRLIYEQFDGLYFENYGEKYTNYMKDVLELANSILQETQLQLVFHYFESGIDLVFYGNKILLQLQTEVIDRRILFADKIIIPQKVINMLDQRRSFVKFQFAFVLFLKNEIENVVPPDLDVKRRFNYFLENFGFIQNTLNFDLYNRNNELIYWTEVYSEELRPISMYYHLFNGTYVVSNGKPFLSFMKNALEFLNQIILKKKLNEKHVIFKIVQVLFIGKNRYSELLKLTSALADPDVPPSKAFFEIEKQQLTFKKFLFCVADFFKTKILNFKKSYTQEIDVFNSILCDLQNFSLSFPFVSDGNYDIFTSCSGRFHVYLDFMQGYCDIFQGDQFELGPECKRLLKKTMLYATSTLMQNLSQVGVNTSITLGIVVEGIRLFCKSRQIIQSLSDEIFVLPSIEKDLNIFEHFFVNHCIILNEAIFSMDICPDYIFDDIYDLLVICFTRLKESIRHCKTEQEKLFSLIETECVNDFQCCFDKISKIKDISLKKLYIVIGIFNHESGLHLLYETNYNMPIAVRRKLLCVISDTKNILLKNIKSINFSEDNLILISITQKFLQSYGLSEEAKISREELNLFDKHYESLNDSNSVSDYSTFIKSIHANLHEIGLKLDVLIYTGIDNVYYGQSLYLKLENELKFLSSPHLNQEKQMLTFKMFLISYMTIIKNHINADLGTTEKVTNFLMQFEEIFNTGYMVKNMLALPLEILCLDEYNALKASGEFLKEEDVEEASICNSFVCETISIINDLLSTSVENNAKSYILKVVSLFFSGRNRQSVILSSLKKKSESSLQKKHFKTFLKNIRIILVKILDEVDQTIFKLEADKLQSFLICFSLKLSKKLSNTEDQESKILSLKKNLKTKLNQLSSVLDLYGCNFEFFSNLPLKDSVVTIYEDITSVLNSPLEEPMSIIMLNKLQTYIALLINCLKQETIKSCKFEAVIKLYHFQQYLNESINIFTWVIKFQISKRINLENLPNCYINFLNNYEQRELLNDYGYYENYTKDFKTLPNIPNKKLEESAAPLYSEKVKAPSIISVAQNKPSSETHDDYYLLKKHRNAKKYYKQLVSLLITVNKKSPDFYIHNNVVKLKTVTLEDFINKMDSLNILAGLKALKKSTNFFYSNMDNFFSNDKLKNGPTKQMEQRRYYFQRMLQELLYMFDGILRSFKVNNKELMQQRDIFLKEYNETQNYLNNYSMYTIIDYSDDVNATTDKKEIGFLEAGTSRKTIKPQKIHELGSTNTNNICVKSKSKLVEDIKLPEKDTFANKIIEPQKICELRDTNIKLKCKLGENYYTKLCSLLKLAATHTNDVNIHKNIVALEKNIFNVFAHDTVADIENIFAGLGVFKKSVNFFFNTFSSKKKMSVGTNNSKTLKTYFFQKMLQEIHQMFRIALQEVNDTMINSNELKEKHAFFANYNKVYNDLGDYSVYSKSFLKSVEEKHETEIDHGLKSVKENKSSNNNAKLIETEAELIKIIKPHEADNTDTNNTCVKLKCKSAKNHYTKLFSMLKLEELNNSDMHVHKTIKDLKASILNVFACETNSTKIFAGLTVFKKCVNFFCKTYFPKKKIPDTTDNSKVLKIYFFQKMLQEILMMFRMALQEVDDTAINSTEFKEKLAFFANYDTVHKDLGDYSVYSESFLKSVEQKHETEIDHGLKPVEENKSSNNNAKIIKNKAKLIPWDSIPICRIIGFYDAAIEIWNEHSIYGDLITESQNCFSKIFKCLKFDETFYKTLSHLIVKVYQGKQFLEKYLTKTSYPRNEKIKITVFGLFLIDTLQALQEIIGKTPESDLNAKEEISNFRKDANVFEISICKMLTTNCFTFKFFDNVAFSPEFHDRINCLEVKKMRKEFYSHQTFLTKFDSHISKVLDLDPGLNFYADYFGQIRKLLINTSEIVYYEKFCTYSLDKSWDITELINKGVEGKNMLENLIKSQVCNFEIQSAGFGLILFDYIEIVKKDIQYFISFASLNDGHSLSYIDFLNDLKTIFYSLKFSEKTLELLSSIINDKNHSYLKLCKNNIFVTTNVFYPAKNNLELLKGQMQIKIDYPKKDTNSIDKNTFVTETQLFVENNYCNDSVIDEEINKETSDNKNLYKSCDKTTVTNNGCGNSKRFKKISIAIKKFHRVIRFKKIALRFLKNRKTIRPINNYQLIKNNLEIIKTFINYVIIFLFLVYMFPFLLVMLIVFLLIIQFCLK